MKMKKLKNILCMVCISLLLIGCKAKEEPKGTAYITYVKDTETYCEVIEVYSNGLSGIVSDEEHEKLKDYLSEYGVEDVIGSTDMDLPELDSGEYDFVTRTVRKVMIPDDQIEKVKKALESYTVNIQFIDENGKVTAEPYKIEVSFK